MKDFLKYILQEVKEKRLPKKDAMNLLHQYYSHAALKKPQEIHPLLHRNISDLTEQRFSTRLTGREFFLADHVINGKRVLPGVAYLEMARAAVEAATCVADAAGDMDHTGIRLKNVVWMRPVVVEEGPVEVYIGLYPEDDGTIGYKIYGDSENEAEPMVYSQGSAILTAVEEIPVLDLKAIQAECSHNFIPATEIYQAFKAMGIEYGPGHRGVAEIYTGPGKVLAKVVLPGAVKDTGEQFGLHPSIMDSALQASVGLGMKSGEMGAAATGAATKPSLPFALQEIDVLGNCEDLMWAVIEYGKESKASDKVRKIDIDLCDGQGNVLVRMKGFASRVLEGEMETSNIKVKEIPLENFKTPPIGTMLLTPAWDTVTMVQPFPSPLETDQVLIVGGDQEITNAIRQNFPKANLLNIEPQYTIDMIITKLKTNGLIDHLVWISSNHFSDPFANDQIIEEQENGVLQIFRIIKALISLGYGNRNLSWTVITTQTQSTYKNDAVNPTHASIYGLIGSLAKEYSNWKIRLVDLEANHNWPISEIFNLPVDPQGNSFVYRGREWHQQKLIPYCYSLKTQSPYRTGGVYVVIGGAGGIGAAWTEYMIRTYQAHIIWIGRRPKDPNIQAKLDQLAELGPVPYYIAADCRDLKAMQHAYREIKTQYSQIHGIIHSAIVLEDQSLRNMDEERFRKGLTAKIDISVRIAQVFNKEPLDWVLFFSSFQSFIKASGQSNYASGCTFKDAFAHRLALEWPCKVKVMNWGYWGNIGIVASQSYQERMAQAGIDSIEPPEAMEALKMLLDGPIDQMIMLKTTKPLDMNGLILDESITVNPESPIVQLQNIQMPLPHTL